MQDTLRHDWQSAEVQQLFDLPFADLLYKSHQIHRQFFDPNAVQISTLLSIKTGTCPEDCAYCSQSVHNQAVLKKEALLDMDAVLTAAKKAKDSGASRFCMAAGWRSPKEKDFALTLEMIKQVKAMGLETCVSLGMLSDEQVLRLKEAGLDFYNHNLDTSPDYYQHIITTRTYQDRLDTLERVRCAGIHVCCGGIVGLGESLTDRVEFLRALANLPEHPSSVPINLLVKIPGTPLADVDALHPLDFARTVAVARIMMPASMVRLTAGRQEMSDELQALCFFAGANSIHYGEKLLTTPLPDTAADQTLLARLGMYAWVPPATTHTCAAEDAHA